MTFRQEVEVQTRGPNEGNHTDQGAQFTSDAFTSVLKKHGVAISMDGKGRFLDNIFVERLWRSVKYEEVYLHAYDNPKEARAGIGRYFDFYNHDRPHQALGFMTPKAFYEHDVAKRATKSVSVSVAPRNPTAPQRAGRRDLPRDCCRARQSLCRRTDAHAPRPNGQRGPA